MGNTNLYDPSAKRAQLLHELTSSAYIPEESVTNQIQNMLSLKHVV